MHRKLCHIGIGLVFLVVSGVAAAGQEPAPKSWGDKITLSKPLTLAEAVKSVGKDSGEVLVKAKTVQVCAKKGCWLTLASPEGDIRVTFKGYKFFVPLSLRDQEVLVQGKLVQETISVADQQHFLKDEGRPEAEIEAVKEPRKVLTMVASGVERI